MSIKQNGGVFGRNPTFNDVTIEGQLTFDGDIDINSDLKVDGDIETTGNVIIATSGKGIDFSATSGTGTSELLDDYEEGTWTPVLNFGGADSGIVYSSSVGRYTKIGRMVYSSFSIILSNKGTSTGDVTVVGSPFANYDAKQNNAGTVICEGGGSSWPQGGVYGMVWSGSQIFIRTQGVSSYAAVTDANFSNSTHIFGMMVYETS